MRQKQLAPVQIALGVALVGSVVLAAAPAFLKNLRASRLAEPMERLAFLAERATAHAAGQPIESAYPAPAPLTPATVPRGELVLDLPGTWDHPTWRVLGFRLDDPHAFSYSITSENGPERARFRAFARGDLDGDGTESSFTIEGEYPKDGTPSIGSLAMHREVE